MIRKIILMVLMVNTTMLWAQFDDKYTYSSNAKHEYTINTIKILGTDADYLAVFPGGVLEIPEEFTYGGNTCKVTDIAGYFGSDDVGRMDWLTKVIIPSTVVRIGNGCFQKCKNLKEVIIKGDVKEFGNQFLYGCTSIETIVIEGKTPDQTNFMKNLVNSGNAKVKVYLAEETTDPDWTNYIPTDNVIVGEVPSADGSVTIDDSNRKSVSAGTGDITYKREFKNVNWQTWFECFPVSFDEWDEYYEIAELVNIHTRSDGSWTLELKMLEAGDETLPNMPYAIRAKNKGTFTSTFVNKTREKFTSKQLVCKSTERTYTFIGNTSKVTLSESGLYVASAGNLKRVASTGVSLNGGRWYMKLENRLTQVTDLPTEVRFRLSGEDFDEDNEGEVTSIFGTSTTDAVPVAYYSTSGVKLNSPKSGVNFVKYSDGATRKIVIK